MTLPELYLLRHGQTEWNLAGRLQGRLDSTLTAFGREQARSQAAVVATLPPDLHRYASTAGRAVQTAQIVFGGGDFTRDPRLVEIDIGDFTGETEAALRVAHPQIFASGGLDWYDHTPDGENFAALGARVCRFLHDLPGPAIIVAHGITLRMVRLIATDAPLSQLEAAEITQGAVHHIRDGMHRVIG